MMSEEERFNVLLGELAEIKAYVSVLFTLKKTALKLGHEQAGNAGEDIDTMLAEMLDKHYRYHSDRLKARLLGESFPDDEEMGWVH